MRHLQPMGCADQGRNATMRMVDVRPIFDSVATKYDLNNRLLSIGKDVYWRRKTIEEIRDINPESILDVGTGTADLAIASADCHPKIVIGVDITKAMVEVGRAKISKPRLSPVVSFVLGKAENLPFQSDLFDAVITSFGVRNFEDVDQVLREMYRVLRKGGKVAVMEFSRPTRFPFRQMHYFILGKIFPLIGRSVSRQTTVYSHYLPQTIMEFAQTTDLMNVLRKAGFSHAIQKQMTLGIVSIYIGIK